MIHECRTSVCGWNTLHSKSDPITILIVHFINADVVNAMMFPFCTTRFVLGPFVPVVLFLYQFIMSGVAFCQDATLKSILPMVKLFITTCICAWCMTLSILLEVRTTLEKEKWVPSLTPTCMMTVDTVWDRST